MNTLLLIHLFHILIVGSLFLYVGIYKNNIHKIMYPFLLVLGIFVILYHIYKAYNYLIQNKNSWLFNLIHIFLVGPLLIYIGISKEKTPRFYYELLLMIGFAAIGYHGYYMLI